LKKGNAQNRNIQKRSPRNNQLSVKASPKISNLQVFKNNRDSTEKQAQILGKTAKFAALLQ